MRRVRFISLLGAGRDRDEGRKDARRDREREARSGEKQALIRRDGYARYPFGAARNIS